MRKKRNQEKKHQKKNKAEKEVPHTTPTLHTLASEVFQRVHVLRHNGRRRRAGGHAALSDQVGDYSKRPEAKASSVSEEMCAGNVVHAGTTKGEGSTRTETQTRTTPTHSPCFSCVCVCVGGWVGCFLEWLLGVCWVCGVFVFRFSGAR
jgi:hypothetical protein